MRIETFRKSLREQSEYGTKSGLLVVFEFHTNNSACLIFAYVSNRIGKGNNEHLRTSFGCRDFDPEA